NAAGQKVIIDLYCGRDLSENDFQRLAESRDAVKDDAIAILFQRLHSLGNSGSRRQIFLAALHDSLAADSNASNYLLQNFDKLDLNEQEFRSATEPLCRFKADAQTQNNWTFARNQMDHYANAHGFSEAARSAAICP
ncbi:MAG: hypothetical protein JST16_10135, partial [Bdellovibrionales bacterium]|nr:hypothetical protein [Bdellovibrionales bacterium]